MSLKYDLPKSFYGAATLLDANYSFSLLDENVPSSKIFSELYVTKKGDYDFLKIGTRSDYHNSAYLYTETGFKDIGGGLMTFERRYARIPDSSFAVESISVPVGRVYVYGSATYTQGLKSVIGAKLSSGSSYLNIDGELRQVYIYQSTNENLPVQVTTKYYAADIDGTQDGGVSFGNSTMLATFLPEEEREAVSLTFSYWGNSGAVYTYRVRGSLFPFGTLVKREPAGRYAGNIYAYKEYALQNDLAVNMGRAALD
tara:strand:+ start:13789 stop:14556 length:768 start_codon:yes stop_codon:yes gene_type:complete